MTFLLARRQGLRAAAPGWAAESHQHHRRFV